MKSHLPRALSGFLLAALVALTSKARADEEQVAMRLPVAVTQRPITQPRLVLSPHLDFAAVHTAPGIGTYLDGGGAFGITDDFEVHADVLPLQLSAPGLGVQYGEVNRTEGPSLGAVYRFVRGRFELGLGVDARVFTIPGIKGFAIGATLPMRFHTDNLRIDLTPSVDSVHQTLSNPTPLPPGPGVPVAVTTLNGGENPVRLFVPVRLLYNIEEDLHIGANSGLTIYDLGNSSNTTGIPIGAFAGFAWRSPVGPVLDIDPFMNFPYFFTPGRTQATNTTQWVLGVNLIGHLYF